MAISPMSDNGVRHPHDPHPLTGSAIHPSPSWDASIQLAWLDLA